MDIINAANFVLYRIGRERSRTVISCVARKRRNASDATQACYLHYFVVKLHALVSFLQSLDKIISF
jgi:hypothetical protein